MILAGELFLADFEQAGRHPMIVVSREESNRGKYVLCVMCPSANFSVCMNLPNCVPFRVGEFRLTKDCVAQCENMLSLPFPRSKLATTRSAPSMTPLSARS
jgi:mRNA-degrading endonuclease toxin of MazEF toxin-antitoxin module